MRSKVLERILRLRRPSLDIGEDVRRGLAGTPKRLPSKYFYDALGSDLFDRICELPEYYISRIERVILARAAADIAERTRAAEIVELGPGMAHKTRLLLEAFLRENGKLRYVPLDISEAALEVSAALLSEAYPGLEIDGIVGDYTQDLGRVAPRGCCLVAFFGSSIGNLTPDEAARLLVALRARLAPGDWLLLGVDLVKAREVLEAAYNDAQGVTAAFNRNILSVVNRELQADFDPRAFDHLAFFNAAESRVEMPLAASSPQVVHVAALGLTVSFALEERLLTELSCKYTRASLDALLGEAGFVPARVYTDDAEYFALALARAGGGAGAGGC